MHLLLFPQALLPHNFLGVLPLKLVQKVAESYTNKFAHMDSLCQRLPGSLDRPDSNIRYSGVDPRNYQRHQNDPVVAQEIQEKIT